MDNLANTQDSRIAQYTFGKSIAQFGVSVFACNDARKGKKVFGNDPDPVKEYVLDSQNDLVKAHIAANPKEWIFTKFAGILLLIPGFITDFCGVFLLIKSLRYLIWDFVPDKTKNYFYDDQRKSKDKEIIEVDYKDLDDK